MTSRRDPEGTRKALLDAAFWSFYRNGYQGANLDDIVREAGMTKGALYHHFPDKQALGYAVIEHVVRPWVMGRWDTLRNQKDPITAMAGLLRDSARNAQVEMIRLGCPLNNLAQEMSPLDEGFRWRLERVLHDWRNGIAEAFRSGQRAGTVKTDVDPDRVAMFSIAVIQGSIGVAKTFQGALALQENVEMLISFLETLRRVGRSAVPAA
jgi:TetR/AcrR family transcriptional repressor of nem operon